MQCSLLKESCPVQNAPLGDSAVSMFLHSSHLCILSNGLRRATFACHDKPHACADTDGEKKALAKEGDGGPGSAPQSYVLAPIDGRLLYLRRGKDVRESEEQAIQEADVTLESISLHLSSAQPSLCQRKETRLPAVMLECQQHLYRCLSEKAITPPVSSLPEAHAKGS